MTSQCRKVNSSFYTVEFLGKGSDKGIIWQTRIIVLLLPGFIISRFYYFIMIIQLREQPV